MPRKGCKETRPLKEYWPLLRSLLGNYRNGTIPPGDKCSLVGEQPSVETVEKQGAGGGVRGVENPRLLPTLKTREASNEINTV